MNFEGKKKVNVCASEFGVLIKANCILIDKTSFIQRLIDEDLDRKVCLFTRPRRFGKTLTLDMLKTFFDAENASENRKLFRGLQIEQAGERYMAEQGQYPVISLTFAGTKPSDYKDFQIKMTAYLREVCQQFKWLLNSQALDKDDKNLLKMWCKLGTPLGEYTRMLSTLSQWLQKAHPQHHPVILLIDEYDTTIQTAFHYGYYDDAIAFFRDFFCNGLKINPHLKFAVMTGILRITKESIFSGLNNFIPNTIFDTEYSDVFGFTQAEVEQMLEHYECSDKKDEVRQWYDGYNFGGRQIYNPWSVLNYLKSRCKPVAYWINTANSDHILEICSELNSPTDYLDFEQLMLGRVLKGEEIDISVTYGDGLRKRSVALGYLLMAGYLKAQISDTDDDLYDISVPNYEVRKAFRREILMRMQDTYNLASRFLREFPKAVVKGDLVKFQELLQAYILKVCSYHDGTSNSKEKRPESFYHGVMVGLSAAMSDYYMVKSNLESGLGRPDLLFTPRLDAWQPPNLPFIVMEFKKATTSDNLQEKAREALAQIHQRQYNEGIDLKRTRLLYGLAFRSKEVAILAEEVNN